MSATVVSLARYLPEPRLKTGTPPPPTDSIVKIIQRHGKTYSDPDIPGRTFTYITETELEAAAAEILASL